LVHGCQTNLPGIPLLYVILSLHWNTEEWFIVPGGNQNQLPDFRRPSCCFLVLGIKSRTLHMLGKYHTVDLHPQPSAHQSGSPKQNPEDFEFFLDILCTF
jgi:hypothetical protein